MTERWIYQFQNLRYETGGIAPRLHGGGRKTLPKPKTSASRGVPAQWDWKALRPSLQRYVDVELPAECRLPAETGLSIAARCQPSLPNGKRSQPSR